MKPLLLELLTGRGPLIPLLGLALAGALVYLLASRLARDADTIAEPTGLGGLWIGSVLLAASTSLPEMLTDVNAALLAGFATSFPEMSATVSAVRLGALDLAVGNLSSIFAARCSGSRRATIS